MCMLFAKGDNTMWIGDGVWLIKRKGLMLIRGLKWMVGVICDLLVWLYASFI